MSKTRHTEAQIIGVLKQLEAGRKAEDVAREAGVSKHTIYAWKAKYGGMDVSQAQEAKQLRDENTKLRKLVADLSLDKEALQSVILRSFRGRGGKLIQYYGWSDPDISPLNSIDYYHSVEAFMGHGGEDRSKQIGDFYRLFMVPGSAPSYRAPGALGQSSGPA